jgi:GNAT superfamily N-acetyltransferase
MGEETADRRPGPAASPRPAVAADAGALADLHIRAWQWAYRGQMPDAFLDALAADRERRAAWRRDRLARAADDERTWVVEIDGAIVGFADTGPSRDADATPGTAELLAIYLDQAVIGRGVGRRLLAHAVADLRQRGYRAATLWVLAGNERARRFYAAAGWRPDGATKIESGPGFELQEVRYRLTIGPDSAASP